MLLLLAFLLLSAPAVATQAGPSVSPSRSCPNNWNASPPVPKGKAAKHTNKQAENTTACIELPFSALEVQEYLQSYGRKANWKIVNEHQTEDTWSFSLALEHDELLADTKAGTRPKDVAWRSGLAFVQVSSLLLADGFTRSIIRASFRGYGEGADQFAMQKEYWGLQSNGNFEASLVAILKANFAPSTAKASN